MQNLHKEINYYIGCLISIVYKGSPKLKMSATTFKKEVEAAMWYATMNAAQVIMENHKENHYTDIDEMLGDIHILNLEGFKKVKKGLNLKIKNYQLEDLIK